MKDLKNTLSDVRTTRDEWKTKPPTDLLKVLQTGTKCRKLLNFMESHLASQVRESSASDLDSVNQLDLLSRLTTDLDLTEVALYGTWDKERREGKGLSKGLQEATISWFDKVSVVAAHSPLWTKEVSDHI